MKKPSSFLRLIDANYNRAKEALRVSEDIARFLMDDAVLTSSFKQTRHGLTRAILRLPVSYRQIVAARSSADDVGRESAIQDLKRRPSSFDLLVSNIKRAQEALRVLEEFAKIVAPHQAKLFQKLRFKVYELEKICFRKF